MPLKYKGEAREKCCKSCCTEEQNTSVFLLNGEESTEDLEMVQLKHPGTQEPAYFVFSKGNVKVYELLTFSDNFRSYFIDETVKSNGNLYMTTPMDPVLLALPYLSSSVHCSPIDQILIDEEYPQIERLLNCPSLHKNLTKIADKKGSGDVFGYKYNEEKTMEYLAAKVMRTISVLVKKSIIVSSSTSVTSNNFHKHSSDTPSDNVHYLKYAFGMVSEYLSSGLKQKLQTKLNISSDTEPAAVKRNRSVSRDGNPATTDKLTKKNKLDNVENSPPTTVRETQKVKTPVVSAKEKARAKAASGTKCISSFFKKSAA